MFWECEGQFMEPGVEIKFINYFESGLPHMSRYFQHYDEEGHLGETVYYWLLLLFGIYLELPREQLSS